MSQSSRIPGSGDPKSSQDFTRKKKSKGMELVMEALQRAPVILPHMSYSLNSLKGVI